MRQLRVHVFGILAALVVAPSATAQEFGGDGSGLSNGPGLFGIFDEVRTGGSFSVQPNDDSGLIIRGEVLFRSFVPPFQNYFANTLFRPRIHVGGNLATAEDGISQVFAGLTWHFPIYDRFFLEATFGGTVHNGPLESADDGLDLGCHLLFRESIGVGVDLGERWRVLVAADHSSHAGLCDDGNAGNSGLTHVGAYVGYRF
jgi:hypothetical protein